MAKNVLTIRDLGENNCWMIVQQAMGIPDATLHTDFLAEKVAVLFFGEPSLPERLCISAAIRQMGGDVVYQSDSSADHWRTELHQHQLHLLPIFNKYLDCVYLYGIPMSSFYGKDSSRVSFPTINAGSPDAHPAHVLADIAFMLKSTRYLNSLSCAWLGSINGTPLSLIAASNWFPITLRIALPKSADVTYLRSVIGDSSKIEIVSSLEDAVIDAQYIFVGNRLGIDYPEIKDWELDKNTFARANKKYRIFLAARPIHALPLNEELMEEGFLLLEQQSEYRLRVHKRILHYVFSE
ncbi:MAG: ornithine carbamoyltransferase [Desulfovibrio sp.]|nr:ornithine carbamoyltransferase [Desulfovibrio sp.]